MVASSWAALACLGLLGAGPARVQAAEAAAAQAVQTTQTPQTTQPTQTTRAGQERALERVASEIGALMREDPEWPDELFHPDFYSSVPKKRLRSIFERYHKTCGSLSDVVPHRRESDWAGKFNLLFDGNFSVEMDLAIESSAPHRISLLIFQRAQPVAADFEELVAQLAQLKGSVSFAVCRLGEKQPQLVHALEPERALGIGSAFKLYLLGTLLAEIAAGERSWSDTLPLDESLRSLPSGFLRSWPQDAPLSLYSLAALMISQSDNTASDHLLFELGRERVEAQLEPMGNQHAERNRPFLSTGEMFRLKGLDGGAGARRFVELELAQRRAMLAGELKRRPVREVDIGLITQPNHIDSIEWFASAHDLCRAMDWLRRASADGPGAAARGLLGINRGLQVPAASFRYAGYKGGSEGGVLNLTFLLQDNGGGDGDGGDGGGGWWALSLGWNDPAGPLKEQTLYALANRALYLLGREALGGGAGEPASEGR